MSQWVGKRCCLGNYVTSQWVGDIVIDTKQTCDQQPGSFTQDRGGRKTWIFYMYHNKHECSETLI